MILLNVNFDKSITRLSFLLIFFMLTIFLKDKKLIVMLSIEYLNFNICNLKLYLKNKSMDCIEITSN